MPSKRSFSKPAFSIDEQIALLKRRGLQIPSEEEARQFLRFVSYYRLSAYTYYYEEKNADKTRSHRFYAGKSFKDITDLYVFDSKLRRLFWEAIERVEIAFRTSLTYHLSLKHGAHWYTDKGLFLPSTSFPYFNHDDFIDNLKFESGFGKHEKHNKRLGGEVFINHYYTNYHTPELPPCWMATEIIPLGRLSRLYSSLAKLADQKLVARDFGLDRSLFTSWMRSLSYMRNLCAHYCRIWNRTFNVNQPAEPKNLRIVLNPQDRVYSFVVICAILLKRINPETKWTERVLDLLKEYPTIPRDSMGFRDGWEKESIWK